MRRLSGAIGATAALAALAIAQARLSPDGRTLYFASDRTLGVTFPTTPQQAAAALQRMHDWDNGNYNIWRVPLAPWLVRRDGAEPCAAPAARAAPSAASGG